LAAVAFSADGARVVTAGPDRSIRLWTVDDGRLVRTIDYGSLGEPHQLLLLNDRIIAGFAHAGAIAIWNASDGRSLATLRSSAAGELHADPGGGPVAVVSPDGKLGATSGGADRKTILWDVDKQTRRAVLDTDPAGIVWSPDGKLLLSIPKRPMVVAMGRPVVSDPVRVWSSAGRLVSTLKDTANSQSLGRGFGADNPHLPTAGFLPGASRVLVINADPRVYDVQTGARQSRLEVTDALLGWSEHGGKIVTVTAPVSAADTPPTLTWWSYQGRPEGARKQLKEPSEPEYALFPPETSCFLVVGASALVVWDLEASSGAVLFDLPAESLGAIGTDAKCRRLVTGVRDGHLVAVAAR
jgi:WD40 repeat protein